MVKVVEGVGLSDIPPAPKNHLVDALGREVLDGRPMQPPIGYKRAPSLADQIRSMIHDERMKQALIDAGSETFEESNDFFVEDDDFPSSNFEDEDDHLIPEMVADYHARQKAAQEAAMAPPEPKSAAPAARPPREKPRFSEPSSRGVDTPPDSDLS